jgi:D-glycero-alpha-D-manno-heptose-7-phosphate kinase
MPATTVAVRPKRPLRRAPAQDVAPSLPAMSMPKPQAFSTNSFGRDTMVISRAPVRVSFLGGGTDFPDHFRQHGGSVLVTAINRFAYVTVQPFLQEYFDHSIRLAYRRNEAVKNTAEIQHPAIRAALEKLGLGEGLEMHVMADMPARTGLGSSSSFVVAMLQALHAYCGRFRSARDLSDEAIEIERYILKEAGGWQDQIAAAHGGFSLINFGRDGSYHVTQVPLPHERVQALEEHMLLVYTEIQRDSFSVLGQKAPGATNGEKTKVLCKMSELAQLGVDYLASDRPVSKFGELLHAGWELKKLAGAVTLPQIDEWYEAGLKAGATGGKLLGAGQGGFLLFIAEPKYHDAIRKAVGNRPTVRVRVNAPGAQIIFSQR